MWHSILMVRASEL